MKTAKTRPSQKPRSWLWLQGAAAGVIVALAPGSALLLGVLLCPALVFAAAAGSAGRPAARVMLLMGSAATFGPLRDQWTGGNSVDSTLELLANPSVALWAWIACGFGWFTCEATAMAAALALLHATRHRATALRREQADLIEEWTLDQS